jgi:hypothetical protein
MNGLAIVAAIPGDAAVIHEIQMRAFAALSFEFGLR